MSPERAPLSLRGAPAAEDQPADGEAETKRSERERADGDGLAPPRQPAPAADRLLFLRRERLSAALLANGAAGPEAEIDVVEELRRLVGHVSSV
jgi:hypothetical protein